MAFASLSFLLMSNRIHVLLLSAALTVAGASTARAQTALDRVVGRTASGAPLVISELGSHTVGVLAEAAGVPMGLEFATPAKVRPWTITATGLKLRAVLDAIVAADPRYEWREDDGVVVFRPVASWLDGTEVLNAGIGSLKREDMQAADALIVLKQLFDVSTDSQNSPEDTKHFSLDLPPGRVFDALNGIVRAHGTMVWTMGHANQEGFEVILSLIVGTSGVGFGVPTGRVARREPSSVMAVSRPRPAGDVPVALLDRIVGTRRDGKPLILRSLSALPELADAVGVPMGVEMLPRKLRLAGLPGFDGFPATGLPLRYVLQTLSALDLGYEWREMNGVIVFRPVDAWADADDPLYRLVNNVRLADVSTAEALGLVASLLDPPVPRRAFVPDTRRVTVDLPQGTILELLNAVVRSHGEMSWQWEEASASVRRASEGRGHHMMFTLFGGSGVGFLVP
jgi:hypothetical protein